MSYFMYKSRGYNLKILQLILKGNPRMLKQEYCKYIFNTQHPGDLARQSGGRGAAGRALACDLGAMVQTYSPSTQEAEAGGLRA